MYLYRKIECKESIVVNRANNAKNLKLELTEYKYNIKSISPVMSHLRDLQRLRNTRNIDFYTARNSNPEMPEILHINFDKFLHGDTQSNDNYNKYLQSKELHPKTR